MLLSMASSLLAQRSNLRFTPLVRVVELNVGELKEVELHDGSKATVVLLDLKEGRDDLRQAVRHAEVKVRVNGQTVMLICSMYRLPTTVAGVQIDCPVTRGYLKKSSIGNIWGLAGDARLRLWPAGSPLVAPGTFVYPLKQRWFACDTQMCNQPCFVDGGEIPSRKNILYHWCLDFGGADSMVEVVSATDGVILSAGGLGTQSDYPRVQPKDDCVYIRDDRGWCLQYMHLKEIDNKMLPGARVKAGQKVGILGKEGTSGGWSHLHFDITAKQPSGKWISHDGYAFAWEAYHRQYQPNIIAVARPHHLAWVGDKVILDGTRSWSKTGKITQYKWKLSDGSAVIGSKLEHTYDKSGTYSEILKVSDAEGLIDYDFAVVQIMDKEHPDQLPPTIHACYYPTFDIKPGDEVTFKVRSFRTTYGQEVWDFGDGSPTVRVRSDGNVRPHAYDGYAVTTHRYEKPGHYIVTVERSNERGYKAVGHLQIRVGTQH
jgi:hypothetical protein